MGTQRSKQTKAGHPDQRELEKTFTDCQQQDTAPQERHLHMAMVDNVTEQECLQKQKAFWCQTHTTRI